MNDTTLAEAVKSRLTEICDSLSTMYLAIPASEIMASADRARRRRLGVLAGAGGLAAAAVTVSMALPASHTASGPGARPSGPGAHLAAWTVTRKADGSIQVSFFRQPRDPAALQRTLRADGVPASVTFIGQQNPACRSIPGGARPPAFAAPGPWSAPAPAGPPSALRRPGPLPGDAEQRGVRGGPPVRHPCAGRHGHPPRGAAVRRRPADRRDAACIKRGGGHSVNREAERTARYPPGALASRTRPDHATPGRSRGSGQEEYR